MDLLLKNGMVIDPKSNTEEKLDILVSKGKIEKIAKRLNVPQAREVDLTGKIVTPGFIDMHVHLREPGYEYKEDIESGTKAAAYGGFTAVACMPNTNPAIDNASVVKHIIERAKKYNYAQVFPIGCISKERAGKGLAEIGEMVQAGVVAISDDGSTILDSSLMRRALEYTKMFNLLLIDHCEDQYLSHNGVMNEGYWSTVLGLKGIPACAEEIIVARDLLLSEMTGANIHIAHVSTKGSVALIKEAKRRGIKVTAEVTPHHLIFTEENLKFFDTNFKVNPPLRTKEDREALKKGLKEGVIDAIATDHAPHAEHEKKREFNYAPFGIIGLESAVPLMLTELVHKKVLTFSQLIEKMSTNPAGILGLNDKGAIKEGNDGDFTVLDSEREDTININAFVSKASNAPYHGYKIRGVVSHTIIGGRIVFSREESA